MRTYKKYDEILWEYDITGEVSFVITENSCIMNWAFHVSFLIEETDDGYKPN